MGFASLLSSLGLLIWVGFELVLRRRSDTEAASWRADCSDQGSTRLLIGCYLAAVALTAVLPTLVPAGLANLEWRWVGVALIVVGLGLRGWGMATLGRFYTRTLRTVADQRVVQAGPYRLIRHPGYGGSLLVWIGYALGQGSWLAAALVTALLIGAYIWRINAEETLLASSFGSEYEDYQRRTKRLLPFVY